jgi:CBS domain-containing protein
MDGFDRPDSGLLLVLPVAQVRGLRKVQPKARRERLPRAVRPEWRIHRETPIEEVAHTLELQPALVPADTPLDEVARAMLAHPRVHVVCVVNEEGRLVGILDLRSLADDLFFHIMPEEFLSEVTDLDRVLRFAEKSGMRTVGDAMIKPVWVKRGETVKDAFVRMHEHGLPGLPVVDARYHVVGYVNLLELMAVCLDSDSYAGRPEGDA